ncbi:hypothetical protein SUNI508_12194 [Seiridium unicorne]|uniref:Uncharacterized protein n=1 Tax=Seiridium unicorne TaxID=138068 RepID=A0ABR2UEG4_9PEZI
MSEPSTNEAVIPQSTPGESTPLLSASHEDVSPNRHDGDEPETSDPGVTDSGGCLARGMRFLVYFSFGDAIATLLVGAAFGILLEFKPSYFSIPYRLSYVYSYFAIPALLAAISSGIHRNHLWSSRQFQKSRVGFITIIFDAVIVYWLGVLAGESVDALNFWSYQGHCYSDPKYGTDWQRCVDFTRTATIVLVVYVVLALLLVFAHLLLFVIRFIWVYRSRSQRGGHVSQWRMPAWNFTIEFTIKYRNMDGRNAAVTAEPTLATEDV